MKAVRSNLKQYVTLLVEDVPDVRQFMVTDTLICPERVDIIFRWDLMPDPDRTGWPILIAVSGPRRFPEGGLDRSRAASSTSFTSDDQLPKWLADLVVEHTPTDWPHSAV